MGETIFSKIIRKEIPAAVVYETDSVLAFKDINPQAPVHILIIPKKIIDKIHNFDTRSDSELLAELFQAAQQIAEEHGLSKNGYRLVINNGNDGGQEVEHLHLHLLGGRKMNWPPG
ncbi:MAG: histidine triad nucleotide-binding protein [Ignavibacteriales bacterium]|mgnify:CR=1 FL=1|nr:MAG: histidine triad nucleotide-binding protein [Ignavibacteriaceae bacterium]MBW7871816.1 histidine triad nucleotide-binding protein [Ignavibacteria bacterium]MCZ2144334.1 histidine triad nucleotide-binding protein [Ignavibacteriales bacterium]OQY72748.1 MAG: histidine triad nucleotide-binding protein [Ignavibacteriales bacterium UTCHB3]MBV6446287.1 Purine nucleoside phosphoramidase [Ignavibacteriaceae bacterium]